ncbi:MAG: type VI secretion system tube protein Hcp [Rubrivivax sp.]
MKFGTEKGEVSAEGYKEWIELQSLQWGVGRGISAGVGGASKREASAPSVSEITVSKTMDAFSPLALKEALGGKGCEVKLDITRTDADGKHHAFQKYVLDNVLISGYSISSGGERPSESLSLNFTKVNSEYVKIDDKYAETTTGHVMYDLSLAKTTV